MICYNSRDEKYKNPFGAVPLHTEVQFFVSIAGVPENCRERSVNLIIAREDEPPQVVHGIWDGEGFRFAWMGHCTGLYFYFFESNDTGYDMERTNPYQLTVYETDECCIDWLSCGVMYQIFPDRFARSKAYATPSQDKPHSVHETWGEMPVCGPDEHGIVWNNDFFGGNFRGIIENLDYLVSLGVTVIYLNPIFKAFSNHRYDTGDYLSIDPMLGSTEDFELLCKESLNRGIKIIFDGVFNHTGSDSLYFNKYARYQSLGAYQSTDSPYFSWYHFSEHPDRYDCWWGIDTLPALNELDPSCLDFMVTGEHSVIRHWLKAGASGVRLDVADELPDAFLDALREAVKAEKKDAAIIGEVWEDASNKVAYGQRRRYLQGRQLDSVMNYPLKDAIIRYLGYDHDARCFADTVDGLHENYPEHIFNSLMNILGTHDTMRILTSFTEASKDYSLARQKLFSALLLWAFLPGIPCIYYGDEIGMEGYRDPLNRQCFCPERANEEIAIFYRRVLHFRKTIHEIASMKFVPRKAEGGFYSFERRNDQVSLIVGINDSQEPVTISAEGKVRVANFLNSGSVVFDNQNTFTLEPGSGIVIHVVYA